MEPRPYQRASEHGAYQRYDQQWNNHFPHFTFTWLFIAFGIKRGCFQIVIPILLPLAVIAVIRVRGLLPIAGELPVSGILLIAVSLAFVMHSFYYLSNGQIALWMLTGMPQLVAGSLLLIGWRIKKTG